MVWFKNESHYRRSFRLIFFTLVLTLTIGGCSKRKAASEVDPKIEGGLDDKRSANLIAAQKANSGIEGRWVMPRSPFMHIEVNFRPDGTYWQNFMSDVKGSNGISTGNYTFNPKTGVLNYGYIDYHRTSANGLELLMRDDSWAKWKAKKQIYVALIKISDDPKLEVGHIESDDPILDLLYSNGVTRN